MAEKKRSENPFQLVSYNTLVGFSAKNLASGGVLVYKEVG